MVKENCYLHAQLDEQRIYAEQQFARHRRQESLQKEADEDALCRLLHEAQAKYMYIDGQLKEMFLGCPQEISNKEVAWRQEYTNLHNAANNISGAAQQQYNELQRLQGQLQQQDREDLATSVSDLRSRKQVRCQRECANVAAAFDALQRSSTKVESDQMDVDDGA